MRKYSEKQVTGSNDSENSF